jgi:hypothetical protein
MAADPGRARQVLTGLGLAGLGWAGLGTNGARIVRAAREFLCKREGHQLYRALQGKSNRAPNQDTPPARIRRLGRNSSLSLRSGPQRTSMYASGPVLAPP